jgi:quercetin dioxygenase-like cupin family protein
VASLRGLVLEDGNILLHFKETAEDNGGARHLQLATYRPHSSPPPYHCHPQQEEVFQILEGGLRFWLDGAERIVRQGDEVLVGKGIYHYAHNPNDAPALVMWETRPALRSGDLYRLLYAASQGKKRRPPLTEAAAILREFSDEFRLAKPPAFIQAIVFGCLAPFGRRALRR